MTPQVAITEPDMLNIRYVEAGGHRMQYIGLPERKDGVLTAPPLTKFQEWWLEIKASSDRGDLRFGDMRLQSAELLVGGYFNSVPVLGQGGKTVMKIIGSQVCDARVVASYGMRKPEILLDWMKTPEEPPEVITSELPEVNDL